MEYYLPDRVRLLPLEARNPELWAPWARAHRKAARRQSRRLSAGAAAEAGVGSLRAQQSTLGGYVGPVGNSGTSIAGKVYGLGRARDGKLLLDRDRKPSNKCCGDGPCAELAQLRQAAQTGSYICSCGCLPAFMQPFDHAPQPQHPRLVVAGLTALVVVDVLLTTVLVPTAIVAMSAASRQPESASLTNGDLDSAGWVTLILLLCIPPLAILSPILGVLALAACSPSMGRRFSLANLQSLLPTLAALLILTVRAEHPVNARLGGVVGIVIPLGWVAIKAGMVVLVRSAIAAWDTWRQAGHITEAIGPAVGLAHRLQAIREGLGVLQETGHHAMRPGGSGAGGSSTASVVSEETPSPLLSPSRLDDGRY